MSTITSVQEAEEAICRGALFQVGGTLIDPDDIVRAKLDQKEPKFWLADGSTVQHDRFKPGETGDYLAEAIRTARRPVTQSQNLLPNANRYLQFTNTSTKLLDKSLNPLLTYASSVSNPQNQELSVANDMAAAQSGGEKLFDLDGNLLADGGNFTDTDAHVDQTKDGGAVFISTSSSTNLVVVHCQRDGTVNKPHDVTISNSSEAIAATINTGTNGYAIVQDSTVLRRFPLDNSTTSGSNFSNAKPHSFIMKYAAIDDQNGVLYYVNDNGKAVSLDVSNLSASETVLFDANALVSDTPAQLTDHIKGGSSKDRFGIQDYNDNTFVLVNEDGKELLRESGNDIITHAQTDRSVI